MNITKVAHELQRDATSQPGGGKGEDWSHSCSACSIK